MQRTVRQILEKKGSQVWTISPAASGYDALVLMADKNIGALVVVDSGKILGIFSERDYARKVILKGKSSKETAVRELMSEKVFSIGLSQTIEMCMAIMSEKQVRHLPVVADDSLVGLVSIGDVVSLIISEQKITIDQLEKYISGSLY